MFDVGFSEMIVIAVVALIVIGPERLPTVARTLGHLLGRLQRYVSDVKTDIQREMQLEELKKLRAEIETQAQGIERTVIGEMQSVEQDLKAPAESLSEIISSTGQSLAGAETPSALSDFDPAKDVPPQTLPSVPVAAAEPSAQNAAGAPPAAHIADSGTGTKA